MSKATLLIRLRDIISIPQELNDIFEICKNEVELSGGGFYTLLCSRFVWVGLQKTLT